MIADPWRYRCPRGHASWRRHEENYWCQSCREHHDHLIDAKTGEVRGEGA